MQIYEYGQLYKCLYESYSFQPLEVTYVCGLCHEHAKDVVYIRMDNLSYCCQTCYMSMFYKEKKI